jgi:hypothetical protein
MRTPSYHPWKLLAAAVVLCLAAPALADEPQGFTPPKPGPEFAPLKHLEGTWDATIHMNGMPESKGTVTYRMGLGGLWLEGDFHGQFGGAPFQGKGLDTYDAAKKKYVSVWVDSMAPTPMISEGTYDQEKHEMVMTTDYPGPDGKLAKHRMVAKHTDPNTIEWKMYVAGKNGGETEMMKITYHRRTSNRPRPLGTGR